MSRRAAAMLIALFTALIIALAPGCGGKEEVEPADSTAAPAALTEQAGADAAEVTDTPSPAESTRFYRMQGGSWYSADSKYFFETDNAIYTTAYKEISVDSKWVNAGYILFSDKEYMDWMPLCGKPNCNHDSLDCNAFFEDFRNSRMWPYGEHIYYFDDTDGLLSMPKLMRMKLDGSDHEVVCKGGDVSIFPPGVVSMGGGYTMTFHDKYAFVIFNIDYSFTNADQDGGEQDRHEEKRIFVFDLDDPSTPRELIFTDEDGNTENRFCVSAGDGDTVYSVEPNFDYDSQTDVLIVHNSSVYKYDISAETRKKLCDLPIAVDLSKGWLEDGKLYCVGADEHERDRMVYPDEGVPYVENFEGQRRMIVAVDIETGEMETVNTALREEVSWAYIFGGYVFGTVHEASVGDLELGTYFYDLSGKFICRIPPVEDTPNVVANYVIGDYVFGQRAMIDIRDERIADYNSTHGPSWYFRLSQVGKEDIVWQKWGE